MRRRVLLLAAVVLAAVPVAAVQAADPPAPETDFAVDLLPENCIPEQGNQYEAAQYAREGWEGPEYERYDGRCRRLKFAVGPLAIKPGQNDVLVQPITIAKPTQDGFVTRFKPDLVFSDGTVTPRAAVPASRHPGSTSRTATGTVPFFAAGEEKTAARFPRGYGMPIKATDQWQLLYMVHSAIPEPQVVYITYEVDFVPQSAA